MNSAFIDVHGSIDADAISKPVVDSAYIMAVKYKDVLAGKYTIPVEAVGWETLSMANKPKGTKSKKTEEKPTYRGVRVIKDKDTGLTDSKIDDIPYKKYFAISNAFKSFSGYSGASVFHEAQFYFIRHNNTFPPITLDASPEQKGEFIKTIAEYCQANMECPILPFIKAACEVSHLSDEFKLGYQGINNHLFQLVSDKFCNLHNDPPVAALNCLIDYFVHFVNYFAIVLSVSQFANHKTLNMDLLLSYIHIINLHTTMIKKVSISDATLERIKDYIRSKEPVKAPKGTATKGSKGKGRKKAETKEVEPKEEEKSTMPAVLLGNAAWEN